nr:hypothetical protein BaRGS_015456 [Batillaria attramentaria]
MHIARHASADNLLHYENVRSRLGRIAAQNSPERMSRMNSYPATTRDDTALQDSLYVDTNFQSNLSKAGSPETAGQDAANVFHVPRRRESRDDREQTAQIRHMDSLDVSDISMHVHSDRENENATERVKEDHDSGRGSEVTSIQARDEGFQAWDLPKVIRTKPPPSCLSKLSGVCLRATKVCAYSFIFLGVLLGAACSQGVFVAMTYDVHNITDSSSLEQRENGGYAVGALLLSLSVPDIVRLMISLWRFTLGNRTLPRLATLMKVVAGGLCYHLAVTACRLRMQRTSFSLPLSLAPAFTFLLFVMYPRWAVVREWSSGDAPLVTWPETSVRWWLVVGAFLAGWVSNILLASHVFTDIPPERLTFTER